MDTPSLLPMDSGPANGHEIARLVSRSCRLVHGQRFKAGCQVAPTYSGCVAAAQVSPRGSKRRNVCVHSSSESTRWAQGGTAGGGEKFVNHGASFESLARSQGVAASGPARVENVIFAANFALRSFAFGALSAMKWFPLARSALKQNWDGMAQTVLELLDVVGEPPRRITPSTVNQLARVKVHLANLLCILCTILSVVLCGCAFWSTPEDNLVDMENVLAGKHVGPYQTLLVPAIAGMCGGVICCARDSPHPLQSALLLPL